MDLLQTENIWCTKCCCTSEICLKRVANAHMIHRIRFTNVYYGFCLLQSTQMRSKCMHPNRNKYRSFLHSLGHKSGHCTFRKPSCVYKYLRTTRNSSLAHLQNLKYVWPNCRYAQITSYAHMGFWDKFNATSYRSTNISDVQIPV